MEFHKMTDAPRRARDKMDRLEAFSETVLIFDSEEKGLCELAYYDFRDKTWNSLMQDVMINQAIAWCYPPDTSNVITDQNFKPMNL